MRRIHDLSRIISGKSVKHLFKETEKLIKNQTEINGVTTIDHKEHTWRSTSLLCSRAYQITTAKTYVFADSVLCLGSMRDEPIEAWKNKNKMVFGKSLSQRSESHRRQPDGVRVENIPRIHNVEPPRGDSKTNDRITV